MVVGGGQGGPDWVMRDEGIAQGYGLRNEAPKMGLMAILPGQYVRFAVTQKSGGTDSAT